MGKIAFFTNLPRTFGSWATAGRPARLGRRRDHWKKQYDRVFGLDCWRIAHSVQGKVLWFVEAASFCEESYFRFFQNRKDLADWLLARARDVYVNAHSNIRSGCDYLVQERKTEHIADIAIRNALNRLGLGFKGEELICVGRKGRSDLCSGSVPFFQPDWIAVPSLAGWWQPGSVECFWQSNQVLLIPE
jgi:hypothetical protein